MVDFDAEPGNKDRMDSITAEINSKTKRKVLSMTTWIYSSKLKATVATQFIPNPRYHFEASPSQFELKKGSIKLEFRVRGFCTCKVYQIVKLNIGVKVSRNTTYFQLFQITTNFPQIFLVRKKMTFPGSPIILVSKSRLNYHHQSIMTKFKRAKLLGKVVSEPSIVPLGEG